MDRESSLVSLRGWLKQKTSTFHFNKDFYCILIEGVFTLYSDESLTSTSIRIPIQNISGPSLISNSPPAFQFSYEGTTYSFICKSNHEAQRWICALRAIPQNDSVNVNSFELLSQIGKGGSAKVFLARHIAKQQLFAIKVIRKDRLSQEIRQTLDVPERNILMLAHHHFITRLFYSFQTETKLYFVLEYVSGGDLLHHLRKDVHFSPFQIKLYLAEITIALQTLHSMGIIYRDLKPENILLDYQGHIKLADFGLARQIDTKSKSQKNTFCGTHQYLAPEMIDRQPQTFALDFWGLGILAYRLTVGTLPFCSENLSRLFDQIRRDPPRIPKNVDKNTADFIRQLLQKNPAQRLGSPGTDIRKHPYFDDIDFEKVDRGEYSPEFVPQVHSSTSVSNFDSEYTTQSPVDSFVESNSPKNYYPGFSFPGEPAYVDESEEDEERNCENNDSIEKNNDNDN